ncbi:CPXCG motif-containing cysteine-rich protein [Zhongshania aquimaris]|uniref:CPXCG motif-containing cysteine-rich protein n=1 Tax=Zhongshania aquimaris TaxID=2857107 RepID=A0ABS6VQA5_9GAMM|nr:CPXCG motif-containing cysteine-rich protein [Zhongshania aquimaris]MBW2939896.1 CPXCG motif-containing cysteine-rich protein [Zhongshania aquimaris]
MNAIESVSDFCPYCGEAIELLVDGSAGDDQYIEDCEVCCRPMSIVLSFDEEEGVSIRVYAENDAY